MSSRCRSFPLLVVDNIVSYEFLLPPTAVFLRNVGLGSCSIFVFVQGEEFALITPERLQIPPVTANSVVKAKIIRDLDKKPSTDVRLLSN